MADQGGLEDYLGAVVADCYACIHACGRCKDCKSCTCAECRELRADLARVDSLTASSSNPGPTTNELASRVEATEEKDRPRVHYFKYGKKGGALKPYNNSSYCLYCQREGEDEWHRAPSLRLREGRSYVFQLVDAPLPAGAGGLILTEKPEGGVGSKLLPATIVGKPGIPIVFTVTNKTPDYFYYHDATYNNAGYIIRVQKSR